MTDLFTQPSMRKNDHLSDAELDDFRARILAEIDRVACLPIGTFPAITDESRVRNIRHLNDALSRIHNGTYGLCRVTGQPISKERLRLVLHATITIDQRSVT